MSALSLNLHQKGKIPGGGRWLLTIPNEAFCRTDAIVLGVLGAT